MRPVLLRMEGFASFKEAALVDFRGADYFALVGPTGSGKSTVIDAMTFALFGSVPRWNDQRMVSLALAPNVVRGTVSLVFDAGGLRYVATRELRRTKTGVGVKNARLERLADPDALAEVTADTDSLAADSSMTAAVEELLGLSFDNFCQCVVLPQGEFAEFLRAKASDRQKILLKLLGAERYDHIGARANTIASLAQREVEVLSTQLAEFADAMPEAEERAEERVAALRALDAKVDAATSRLLEALGAEAQTQGALTTARAEQETLAALTVPDGVAELADRQAQADATASAAARATKDAETADTAARRKLSKAPERTPLEQARAAHAQHATLTAQLPALVESAEKAAAELAQAAADEKGAQTEEGALRARVTEAEAKATESTLAARTLAGEIAALTAVRTPRGVKTLAAQVRTQADSAHELAEAAQIAEAHAETATQRAPAAADRSAVQEARNLVRAIARHTRDLERLEDDLGDARVVQQKSYDAVVDAQRALLEAQDKLLAARSANLAAALRPELVPGSPCPVCEQDVKDLPEPLAAPAVGAAEEAAAAAEFAVTTAKAEQAVAGQLVTKLGAQHEVLAAERAAAQSELAGITLPTAVEVTAGTLPSDDALAKALKDHEELTLAAGRAQAHAKQARREAAEAADAYTQLASKVTAAVTVLRAARDPLVALGAPDLDVADLASGWEQLTGWAEQQAAQRRERLPDLQDTAEQDAAAAKGAEEEAALAAARAESARAAHLAATSADERSTGLLQQTQHRLRELSTTLSGLPGDQEAAALLEELDLLEAAAEKSGKELLTARSKQQLADLAVSEFTTEVDAGWATLRSVRDRLVQYGAPELPAGSLANAWNVLVTWAHHEAGARQTDVTDLQTQLAQHEKAVTSHNATVVVLLADNGVTLPAGLNAGQLPSAARATIGEEIAQASAEHKALAADRARAEKMRGDRDAAETREQVAHKLGHLLRSTGFPRWLASSALDTLVLDASASLSELSGGQFELTHDKGDFFVVDHADADARRSVRTLSGGETFQASLALALALSSQLGTLGAGATRLDSLFLDEGFGTLDAATLDTVATTLENLASTDRMVGVVTHVPALAERVPTRFAVTRDQRTSRVVREDA